MDLATLETSGRESLAIQNYLDAYLAAALNVVKESDNPDPYLMRLITQSANGLAELVRRSVAIVQQAVLHRRDMALWDPKVKSAQIADLRHAPFLAQRHLFDRALLARVEDDFMEDQRNRAIVKASTPRPSHSAPKPRDGKRPAPAAQSSQPKKGKLQLPRGPAQQQPSTPKSGGKQQYR